MKTNADQDVARTSGELKDELYYRVRSLRYYSRLYNRFRCRHYLQEMAKVEDDVDALLAAIEAMEKIESTHKE